MPSYIYTERSINVRNRNVSIRVYRILHNKATKLGEEHWNTAAWPGGRSAAIRIINYFNDFKLNKYGDFTRKDISLKEVI